MDVPLFKRPSAIRDDVTNGTEHVAPRHVRLGRVHLNDTLLLLVADRAVLPRSAPSPRAEAEVQAARYDVG